MQYIFSMYIFLIVVTLKTLKKQNEKNTNLSKKKKECFEIFSLMIDV